MNYCNIDEDDKKHLLHLIDFIHNEVLRSGGDGDGLWYSEYYNVKDIFPIVIEWNNKLPYKWQNIDYNNIDLISISRDQEGFIITNNEEIYKNAPGWQQILIKY